MGHIHLGVLPRSKAWRDVVALLSGEATDAEIVGASAKAAERDLAAAAYDPIFQESIRLLLLIPFAARADDLSNKLREHGLVVDHAPLLLDLVGAMSEHLDRLDVGDARRSDFSDLSARALIDTFSITVGDALPGFFDATPGDLQAALRKLSWSKGIAELVRTYFGHLVTGTLSYWLDRTLATRIGTDQRFASLHDRSAFDAALLQYGREATRIVQEFSGGWYGKHIHDEGGVTRPGAASFGAVCLKKIVAELARKSGRDD